MQTELTNYTVDLEDTKILDNSYQIEGSMGKGGKSGYTPVEFYDTARSVQVVRLLIAVSEGVCEELTDVFFNYVPASNYSATIEWRSGTPNQTVIAGFEDARSPSTTFSPFTNMTTTGLYISSVNWQAHSTIVTLSTSVMFDVWEDGDIVMSHAVHNIYTRPNGSATWTLAHVSDFWAKISNPWSIDIRIPAPAGVISGTNWEIKIVRISPDDATAKRESKLSWTGLTEIIEVSLNYPNTALVGITLWNAAQFGGQIPDILFKIKGIKVRVPDNYNAINRAYTGSWGGTFTDVVYYTNNPAYVLLDCLTSQKCLGIADEDIDLPSFYLLGTVCDEMVTDGLGGVEPRYTINNQFTVRENVATFLNYILSVCNANFTTNEFGQLSVFFDRADQPITKQVTNANVIGGLFKYSSNDLEQRTGLVNVTYSNMNNYGKTDTATWVDQAVIDRYGFQTLDIALVGCTSQAGAIRKARWACYQNAYLTDIVTFSTLHYGMQFTIGELVRVVDNYTSNNASAGIITAVTIESGNTRITIDRNIFGVTSVSVLIAGEAVLFPVISSTSNTFLVAGTHDITLNSPFLAITDTIPSIWKVIGIDKAEEVYNITCVIHEYSTQLPSSYYSITAFAPQVNEGSSTSFTVSTTNVTNGTVLYWKIIHGTTNNADFSLTEGTVTIQDNLGIITIGILQDNANETDETFQVELKKDSLEGTAVAISGIVTIISYENIVIQQNPPWMPEGFFIEVQPSTVNQGGSFLLVAYVTPDYLPSTVYWSVLDITSEGLSSFTTVEGSIALVNNTGYATLTTQQKAALYSDKTFQVTLKDGSPTGDILAISNVGLIKNPANTVIVPTSVVSTDKFVLEGQTLLVSVEVVGANPVNETLAWRIHHLSTASGDFSNTSGSVAIVDSLGAFNVIITQDNIVETSETFYIEVLRGGLVVATSDVVTIVPPYYEIVAPTTMNEATIYTLPVYAFGSAETTLYYTVENVSTDSVDISPQNGNIALTNGEGFFALTIKADFKVEGSETFTMSLRKNSISGEIVYTTPSITISDTSTATITPAGLSVDEGGSIGFSVSVTGSVVTTVYYTVLDVTTNGEDLSNVSGSITLTNNSGFLLLSAIADHLTEGVETFKVQFRMDSIAGEVFHTTEVITINDTSIYIAPPSAIKSNFAAYNPTTQKVVIFNELDEVTYQLSSNNLSYLGNINTSAIAMQLGSVFGLQTEDFGLGSKIPAIVYRNPQNCSIVVLDTQANTYTENEIVGTEWCDLVYLNGYYYVCNYGFPNPVRKINATTFVMVADSVNIPQQNTNIKVYDGKLWVLTTANSGTGGLFHIRRINPDTLVIEQDYTYNPSLAYLHTYQNGCEIIGTKMYFMALDINNQANFYLYSFDFVTGVFAVVVTAGTFNKVYLISNGIYLYGSTSTGLAKFDTTTNSIVSTQTTDYSIPIGTTPYGIITVHKTTYNMSTALLAF